MQWAWGPVSVHRTAQHVQSIRHGPRLPGTHGEIVSQLCLFKAQLRLDEAESPARSRSPFCSLPKELQISS